MRHKIIYFLLFTLLTQISYSQDDLNPKDYLSKDFHKNRRDALRSKMPKNSIAVFFANPVRNRANDVEYIYHQDPNFYYLTGYKEPHAVLVIYSEEQTENGKSYDEAIYVQGRNARQEMYNGKRLGVEGTKEKLGFTNVYFGSDFKNANINYAKFDKVMIFDFQNDYRNSQQNKADLFDLVQDFKTNANYDKSKLPNPIKDRAYQLIKATDVENSANVAQNLGRFIDFYPDLKKDELIIGYKDAANNELRKEFKNKISLKLEAKPETNIDVNTLGSIMATMREVKLPEELKLLKKAVEISAMGQREIMKAIHPNMSETEIQGIHEFIYKKYGAEYEGYPSIVGGGHNGCILHYIENSKTKVGNDLVLMDLGAEYRGYTADVTRTIPANGTFSTEQKAIYDLVYNAQEAGIAKVVAGETFANSHKITREIINEGLLKLGIIKSIDEKHNYYPHGSTHHIGLDVHDPGNYGKFEVNMVVTVEPGIYIPANSPCDEKWWGIAVRIEDDILVTENGPVNLSGAAPRKSGEIEALMKETSVLNNFELPDLDK